MSLSVDRVVPTDERAESRVLLGNAGFAMSAAVVEVLAILALAVATGIAYHYAAYGSPGDIENYLTVGELAALGYTLPFVFRDEYGIHAYLEGRREFGRTFIVWNTAILSLAVIGFLTKTTGIFSRGWLLLFYAVGLSALTGLAALTGRVLASLIASGRVASRRIMLVGAEEEIRRIRAGFESDRTGVRVVAAQVLPPSGSLEADKAAHHGALKPALDAAVGKARALDVDDIVLLTEWSRTDLIHDIVEAFKIIPVAIHLGASSLLGRFSEPRVSRLAAITALSVTAPPLAPVQALTKRAFDAVAASAALVLLAPLFTLIAIAIKMTSPGPVFFRQRRRGFNTREFRIWKFRTMTTLDDGDAIEQVRKNDVRVTRVGSVLRRLNLDELPQLINVVMGEMSLVGPRPHAVAHDRHYEERIGSYPRRLNMKPGITGWAQVNGLRGRTESEEEMRARVEHDLYYIDNWSILFDLFILALTVLSPKAYRNAL